jgi:hypothetical protein
MLRAQKQKPCKLSAYKALCLVRPARVEPAANLFGKVHIFNFTKPIEGLYINGFTLYSLSLHLLYLRYTQLHREPSPTIHY